MTRREFDAATRFNYGGRFQNFYQRQDYKMLRRINAGVASVRGTDDKLELRAIAHAARNTRARIMLEGFLPVLGIGSRFRAPAKWRLTGAI